MFNYVEITQKRAINNNLSAFFLNPRAFFENKLTPLASMYLKKGLSAGSRLNRENLGSLSFKLLLISPIEKYYSAGSRISVAFPSFIYNMFSFPKVFSLRKKSLFEPARLIETLATFLLVEARGLLLLKLLLKKLDSRLARLIPNFFAV